MAGLRSLKKVVVLAWKAMIQDELGGKHGLYHTALLGDFGFYC